MTYHIFLYCIIHDDGFVIESNKSDIPEDYNIKCKCDGSNLCDFIYNGMLYIKEIDIKEIDPILLNYDKYGGNFKFEYYKNYFKKNSDIYNWINNHK